MEKLEKVELVREKCGVSYEEARNALEACDYDVLDAIVMLEREGKAHVQTASFQTNASTQSPVSPEMERAQSDYREQSRRTKFGETWQGFCAHVKRFVRASIDMTFVAEHNGERVIAVPVILMIVGLLAWGATIWLLLIGLFFGFRYHIEGASPLTIDVNDAMDKAADVADGIREDFHHKE